MKHYLENPPNLNKVQLLQSLSEDGRVRRMVISEDLPIKWKKIGCLICTCSSAQKTCFI
jgi:hypothetical protein